jgi:heparin/heparan-sulfate lyase
MIRPLIWICGIGLTVTWNLHAAPAVAGEAAPPPAVSPQSLQWKDAAGTRIPVPPPQRPRLYLRPEHAAQLPARLADPALETVVRKLRDQARKSPQSGVEWNSLQYLVHKDQAAGRAIVNAALELLRNCELPDRQDACRVTGRMMVTGAIVYDWLYELLSREQKEAFIRELIRLAKTQECAYPPVRQGSVTGHASEAMIMRDMISAGIAIYDEYPEMYELAAGRFFREHLPARNWFYHGHAYHQGDSYGLHRYSWDTFPLWIFDRLGAGNVYNPQQRYVPYLWVYATRPDAERLRAGDTFCHSTPRGEPWREFLGTLLTASYYGDGYLLSQYLRQNKPGAEEPLFEFLWRDTALQPLPITDLPRSRYFGPPFGWMIARTGWDENAAIAEMKVNVYNFANHQHLDAGAFQLYCRGALAVDSGLYTGSSGKYGSPHCRNYYWRTIAHNALLVYDPDEVFKGDYGNDGGQRLPNGRSEPKTLEVLLKPESGYRTGEVLAHGFGPDAQSPDFTLLQGDLTAAYGSKVRQVLRSFVFLSLRSPQVPAALIVFDRVAAANPMFRKYWLLHALEEPQVSGTSAVIDRTQHGSQGRLILDALLPTSDNAQLAKVGGPGKEFWVFGTNYANDVPSQALERSSMEPGAWRLELSPVQPAAEDLFLTVMQMTDRQSAGRLQVRRIDAQQRVGCLLQAADSFWSVLLRRDGGPPQEQVSFVADGKGAGRYLVADLAPGKWEVRREGSQAPQWLEASGDLRALWFEGPPGKWSLSRKEP